MLNEAQSLQFAWFFLQTPDMSAEIAMKSLLGLDADQAQTNRVPTPQQPFLSSAVRSEGAFEYRLNISAGRADLFVTPSPSSPPASGEINLIDVKSAAVGVLERLHAQKWDDFGDIYRLAIVAPFIRVCKSLKEAQDALFERTGIDRIDGEITDLSFSFNKRKISSKTGIKLNRLIRYSTAEFHNIRFEIGQNSPDAGRVAEIVHAFEMNVDVNSVPNERTIERTAISQTLSDIFDELVEAAHTTSPQQLS